MSNPMCRRAMFTLNNAEGIFAEEDFAAMGARYMVFQEEVGEQGTYHLQGYVEFPKAVRWSHIKRYLGDRVHLDNARGTPEQCKAYCTKEDTRVGGPYEFGEMGGCQGKRSDLLALRDAVREGKRGRELFDDDEVAGAAIKFQRGVGAMEQAYSTAPVRDDIRVVLHFGPPGCGKTHCAHQEDAYYFDGNNGEFWIGYTDQSTCILDEFGGHTLRPLTLQRLCDKYPLWLPIKGGQVPCQSMFFSLNSLAPVVLARFFC
jgi:hypothetical protein